MEGLISGNLLETSRKNIFFRYVVATEKHMQVVMMSLGPGERLDTEVHDGEQLFVVVLGDITVKNENTGDERHASTGDFVMIKEGTPHSVVAGTTQTKVFTVYSPPQHDFATIQPVQPVDDE